MKREEKEMLQKEMIKEMPIPFNAQKVYEKMYNYHILQFRNKRYCGCCGKQLTDKEIKNTKCECGAKLEELPDYKKRKSYVSFNESSVCYTITNAFKDYLVIRTFVIGLVQNRMEKHSDFECHEIMRLAVNEKGEKIFARRPTWNVMWKWDWYYDKDFEIKPYQKNSKYDFNASYIGTTRKPKWLKYLDLHAITQINKEIKKREYFYRSKTILDFVKYYIEQPTYTETLTKLKRYDLLAFSMTKGNEKECMLLARKNREIPTTDFATYHDYLNGLQTLGKDLRNIDIVCPKDFVEANKRIEKQCKKIRDKEELKQNIKQYNQDYVARISGLIGMDFGNEKYHITILTSVNDFYEEALSMCHCVYRMGYYKNKDSYIFSVKNAEHKRLETAEIIVNKKQLALKQCYGYGDKFTEYHNEITKLINATLNDIRRVII